VTIFKWLDGLGRSRHNRRVDYLAEALGWRRVPGLWRRGDFLLAAVAGVVVWGALWVGMGESPGRGGGWEPWSYLHLVAVTPLLEELAFRGALTGWVRGHSWGRSRVVGISRANLLVTALFVAGHLLYHPPLWAVSVVFPSLVFGHLRDRTHSVIPAILMHMWYNAGYFALVGVG